MWLASFKDSCHNLWAIVSTHNRYSLCGWWIILISTTYSATGKTSLASDWQYFHEKILTNYIHSLHDFRHLKQGPAIPRTSSNDPHSLRMSLVRINFQSVRSFPRTIATGNILLIGYVFDHININLFIPRVDHYLS